MVDAYEQIKKSIDHLRPAFSMKSFAEKSWIAAWNPGSRRPAAASVRSVGARGLWKEKQGDGKLSGHKDANS